MLLILLEILVQENMHKIKLQFPEIVQFFTLFADSAVRHQKVG